jgi:hypothetical protein
MVLHSVVRNPAISQTSEIQARQAILIPEQTRTSVRFRVISFLNRINVELLRFFAREPIVRPIPVPAREPSASIMRISKAFIAVYFLVYTRFNFISGYHNIPDFPE